MAESFTGAAWSSPESDLSPSDFCAVCLVDLNASGDEKVKDRCYLPVRSRPGGPVNKNAVCNAMARLMGTKIPAEAKRAAARKLVRLARRAGIEVTSNAVLRLADEG